MDFVERNEKELVLVKCYLIFSDVRESLRITMLDLFMNSEEKEFRDNVLNEHYSFLRKDFYKKKLWFSSNSTFDYKNIF